MNITGKLDAQHQEQHEDDEQIEVREVTRVPRVFPHVPDAEQVNQAAHARDHQQHHGRELVHLECHSPPASVSTGIQGQSVTMMGSCGGFLSSSRKMPNDTAKAAKRTLVPTMETSGLGFGRRSARMPLTRKPPQSGSATAEPDPVGKVHQPLQQVDGL